MKILFREEQKFTQWWLWLILFTIAILPFFEIYKNYVIEGNSILNSTSISGIVLYSIFVFGLIVLFLFLNLTTEINQKEIRMNFFPFTKKRVSWKEIKSAKIVNYGFVGGWGIRFGTKFGTVYNTKGNKGLALELVNGKKFLIGTQKESELEKVVENLITNQN